MTLKKSKCQLTQGKGVVRSELTGWTIKPSVCISVGALYCNFIYTLFTYPIRVPPAKLGLSIPWRARATKGKAYRIYAYFINTPEILSTSLAAYESSTVPTAEQLVDRLLTLQMLQQLTGELYADHAKCRQTYLEKRLSRAVVNGNAGSPSRCCCHLGHDIAKARGGSSQSASPFMLHQQRSSEEAFRNHVSQCQNWMIDHVNEL